MMAMQEVEALFWVEYRSEFSGVSDPRRILLHWVSEHRVEFIYRVELERQYASTAAERNDLSKPDTSMYNALNCNIEGWTMLECLKVLKIFEDINKIRLRGSYFNYRMMFYFLNALRNDQSSL